MFDPTTEKIVNFLQHIGLEVQITTFEDDGFLPGIKLEHGALLIDESKLKYPGDLLHEAGHLAVKPPNERLETSINAGSDGAEEMMSIAWSYAAAIHLEIPLEVVFHEHGYKGGGRHLIEIFNQGNGFGVPMLQWLGMTVDAKRAATLGVAAFPHMTKWLCTGRPE
jgi:hypothetical protein